MNKIITLVEWQNSSLGGAEVLVILLACIFIFLLFLYWRFRLKDKEKWNGLLILSIICAILLWLPLNDYVQHRGETFQKICAPNEVTEQQLLEKYDTVKVSRSDYTPDDYNCWQVSFKQVD